jgi:hydrogenase expression/formation protein HypD
MARPATRCAGAACARTGGVNRSAADWLDALHSLGIRERVRIMNVCGGHERSISVAGLRSALPPNIELVPGPGCPVCICPEEDVFEAISWR